MPPETVAALLEGVHSHWRVLPEVEITLEANPNSAEAAHFRSLAAAGINRLSLGVQALDPAGLRLLGRLHSRNEAIAAIEHARETFPRFSFDLIYARPGQSVAGWEAELDEALGLAGEHLSLYQLTIEPGTAFSTLARRGDLVLPEEDVSVALFETTQDRLADCGLPAYEISNHARPGAECRHNLAYWRYQDYLGIGPGAHGRLTRDGVKIATRQHRLPERWLAAVDATGTGVEEATPIDRDCRGRGNADDGASPRRRHRVRAARRNFRHIRAKLLFGAKLGRLIDGGFMSLDQERLAATSQRSAAPQCRSRSPPCLSGLSSRYPGSSAAAG